MIRGTISSVRGVFDGSLSGPFPFLVPAISVTRGVGAVLAVAVVAAPHPVHVTCRSVEPAAAALLLRHQELLIYSESIWGSRVIVGVIPWVGSPTLHLAQCIRYR